MIESNIYLEMILHTNLDLTPEIYVYGFSGGDFLAHDQGISSYLTTMVVIMLA